jgi:N6-L-threonylcarbamoyladenine synthase
MSSNPNIILAIESSCDDTSASIIKDGIILNNIIANQKVHEQYGGVVPELASREHHREILPVIDAALKDSGVSQAELSAIAFTQGPGLLGSLLVGTSFAKGLAWSLGIPLIAVNHMEAHVLAHFIDTPRPNLPFLCLTVSGGHTQIVRVDSMTNMHVLGQTIDDAAGEAFDKIGKFIGLDYPAGPHIDRLAKLGKPNIRFSKPRVDGLDFSFSGLKTAVMYHLRDQVKLQENYIDENLNDICASVQYTIVSILLTKMQKASQLTSITEIGIAGGVSANSHLRDTFKNCEASEGWNVFVPDFQYCTDNAAMIAQAAYFKYLEGNFTDLDTTPNPRLKMKSKSKQS